jgi:uncharacterized protein (TIGR00730 family)
MRHICVFAGSSGGVRAEYMDAARALGHASVRRDLGLVYGGTSAGLMGAIADGVLEAGGEALGVLPRGLFKREIAHTGLTHLYEVESMHARKALMAELADGFIALPGGYGTCDELFEIITWAQIDIHRKPIGLLDVGDYFRLLLAFVERATAEGFIPAGRVELLRETEPAALLDALLARMGSPEAQEVEPSVLP